MYLDAAKKQEIFEKYGKSNTDTGSAEAQIALFSYRISHLTEHLKLNRKDYSTERALTIIAKAAQLTLNEIVNPISLHPMNKSAQSETISSRISDWTLFKLSLFYFNQPLMEPIVQYIFGLAMTDNFIPRNPVYINFRPCQPQSIFHHITV